MIKPSSIETEINNMWIINIEWKAICFKNQSASTNPVPKAATTVEY